LFCAVLLQPQLDVVDIFSDRVEAFSAVVVLSQVQSGAVLFFGIELNLSSGSGCKQTTQ
jgi:hypothetical protein